MKLEKFKEKNKKKTGIIIFTISCILLIAGVFLYTSFALFEEKKNFNVINGHVEDPGDLYFAYYVDDVITYNMPTKDSGYTLDSKSSCTNGVTISWNDNTWSLSVNYQNYQSNTNSRVKCNLYFKEKPSPKEYILSKASAGEIVEDDGTVDHNLRYIGANPNNYIDIGDRDADGNVIPWRIIGLMNNVDDGSGNKEMRLKVIRSEGIGKYSWDSSAPDINDGHGVNEWSQADLMKLLNPGYEAESVGGSLYWNRKSGTCYNDADNATTACDFISNGLSVAAQSVFGTTLWHTGTNGKTDHNQITTTKFYELEQSSNTGKICTSNSGPDCTDTVERTSTWEGILGLMTPSDYGYATSGGATTSRDECLNTNLYKWNGSGVSDCKTNDWLYNSSTSQWTLMPLAHSDYSFAAFYIDNTGQVIVIPSVEAGWLVRPTGYLLSSVRITDGDGTIDNMFKLT